MEEFIKIVKQFREESEKLKNDYYMYKRTNYKEAQEFHDKYKNFFNLVDLYRSHQYYKKLKDIKSELQFQQLIMVILLVENKI